MMAASFAAQPAVAASEPILLHDKAASPPVWCDSSTIVYAVKPDTNQRSLRSIVVQTVPSGEPRELFRDSGSAIPYQCINRHIFYWTLAPTDCDGGPEETRQQAVYVADLNGRRAPLACGAAVALLSPDGRLLAVSSWIQDWRPAPEGLNLVAGGGKKPLIVNLRKPDLFDAIMADDRVITFDFITGRIDPLKVQREYALGNGAMRWLTNDILAFSLGSVDTGEVSLRTIRLNPDTVEIIWTDRVSLGMEGAPLFDSAGPERVYAWSTADELHQVQECWLSDANMTCTTLALHVALEKARAGLAAEFDSDVDFHENYTVRLMADIGDSECLMLLNLYAGTHECLVDHTEKLIVPNHGYFKRTSVSPDRNWLAYVVLKDLGLNGSSNLMLLPLPD
jgi:hypothetical protein